MGNKAKSSNSIFELVHENSSITDKKEITNICNRYFSNIGASLAQSFTESNLFSDYLTNNPDGKTFQFTDIILEELNSSIQNLNNSSPGHDCIPISIHKKNFDILEEQMVFLCDASLRQGLFPHPLKISKVTPIFI